MTKKTVITAFIIAALLSSCSVKEDRLECPCRLTIDLGDCPEFQSEILLKGWRNEEILFCGNVHILELPGRLFEQNVSKGSFRYSVCSPLPEKSVVDNDIIIPKGNQSEPVFIYSSDVNAEGETAYDKVSLHKQFAQMTVSFGKQNGSHAGIVSVTVKAGVQGIGLKSLHPIQGAFQYSTGADDGFFKIRLPRLSDGKISIDAFTEEGFFKTFTIGDEVKAAGFDWHAEDLDDFWIDFDISDFAVSVDIQEWENGYDVYEII